MFILKIICSQSQLSWEIDKAYKENTIYCTLLKNNVLTKTIEFQSIEWGNLLFVKLTDVIEANPFVGIVTIWRKQCTSDPASQVLKLLTICYHIWSC